MKPRVLFVGRTRYRLPLPPSLARKFDALRAEFDARVLGRAFDRSPGHDATLRLHRPVRPRPLDGLAFHLGLPLRVARELRSFRPDAVVVQDPYSGAAALVARALTRSKTPVVVEVHGDWRTATRLYGSRARQVLNPVADWIAAVAVRRADAVRTVSDYTTAMVRSAGVEPAATFPAFMDPEPFLDRPPAPLPDRPAALFVGVLERYKNVDGLAEAWRRAAPRLPNADLRIVGRGARASVIEGLVRDIPRQTSWREELSVEEVARELDAAWFLVLPSSSEGMGRVIIEAFCRSRPVLGARVGGIVDLVEDGVNGVLVEPGDSEALADALVALLGDRAEVERLAEGAGASAARWVSTPTEYAQRLAGIVAQATAS